MIKKQKVNDSKQLKKKKIKVKYRFKYLTKKNLHSYK